MSRAAPTKSGKSGTSGEPVLVTRYAIWNVNDALGASSPTKRKYEVNAWQKKVNRVHGMVHPVEDARRA